MIREIIREIDLYPELEGQEVDLKVHIWITARKVRISVNKMGTSHIINCINCLNGIGNMTIPSNYLGGREKWLKIFKEELIKRN